MKLRNRLSYANVIATLALFLALGGGAFAAFKAPKNSVTTKSIKNNAVKTSKIADGAVTEPKIAANAVSGGKVKDGTLTAAKVASGQVFKNAVVRETVITGVGNNGNQVETINCASGEKAISGGGAFTPTGSRTYSATEIGTLTNLVTPVDANGNASISGQTPTGYLVSLKNVSGATRDYHGYVVCGQL
jgi:hypothetical protein